MTDFIKTLPQAHVTLKQAAESFKPVAHRLSAGLKGLVRRRQFGIEIIQNVSAYNEHFHAKEDPWLLLDRIAAWERITW